MKALCETNYIGMALPTPFRPLLPRYCPAYHSLVVVHAHLSPRSPSPKPVTLVARYIVPFRDLRLVSVPRVDTQFWRTWTTLVGDLFGGWGGVGRESRLLRHPRE